MAANPSLRPSWPDLLDPSFRTIYGAELKQVPTKYQEVFNVMSSKKNIEKDSSASGLSKLVQTAEASAIPHESEAQGYDVTYTHLKFALMTDVSQEMYDDDQFNIMNRKPKNLARAKMRTKEQAAADIFNNGFTAGGGGLTSFTAGDAVALFATNHPRTDGGTAQSNYETDDLAEDSLENALVTMDATLDDKGQLIGIDPSHLLVPPALSKEASILLKSSGRTGTSNNDINPYEGALKLVVWKYLGSTAGGSDTAWFVIDREQHKLNWFNRKDSGIVGPTWDEENEVASWKVSARWSVGFSDWRGVFGSKGDNS